MMKTTEMISIRSLLVASVALGVSQVVVAQQSTGANSIMPWAYVLNAPDAQTGEAPDPDEVVSVP